MICDRVRTGAFRRAIDSVVRPGDVVLDVGAGSGILSVFAARAGAARVYAVERTSAAVLAQELAAANGVAEIVQVIHGSGSRADGVRAGRQRRRSLRDDLNLEDRPGHLRSNNRAPQGGLIREYDQVA